MALTVYSIYKKIVCSAFLLCCMVTVCSAQDDGPLGLFKVGRVVRKASQKAVGNVVRAGKAVLAGDVTKYTNRLDSAMYVGIGITILIIIMFFMILALFMRKYHKKDD